MFLKYFNLTLEIIEIKVKEEKVLQKYLIVPQLVFVFLDLLDSGRL